MKTIAIYTLTSELHDEEAVETVTREFLSSLSIEYDFCGANYSSFGTHPLDLIYVRTGGTEGLFRRLLPQLLQQSTRPMRLLTSGKNNSLAASMEILSFLRQQNLNGEILHGSSDYVYRRILLLAQAESGRRKLKGNHLGIIGAPSDWLISSLADKEIVKERLGIDLVELPMKELLDQINTTPPNPVNPAEYQGVPEVVRSSVAGAVQIYDALKTIINRHQLQGFTLRCFDLLSTVHNTGCLALARLNSEGIVAGCEGDVPAMLSMAVCQALTGMSGFQANPSRINTQTGELLFAHCTIPLNMVEHYEFDTHFESGIGVGIRGYMKEGPVTLFKVSGDLSRSFIAEGELIRTLSESDLCRTQQVIRLADPRVTSYFLNNPIGNHHIIIPGHHKELLKEITLNLES